ncbi:MAG: precorrin-6y C5,15-methyltransferase (decarboxylating) subunit CbiE [Metallosphaera yellowstonensis]|jgi:cobalt-precorrin-7 (C5)-methyltransferase|uniref:Precorrin-6y C5,15-methyltransferase (Decarboxylating), CbiE subunit n=1 Tax=Metallosphaera yellowstonensis MK1 TaxID=671065 RepID=H2C638_9CREN|nr:precorrin-6y C5,15-methyltransferase (decarboxylating) subunit CbiE [Metallosphaera yellowstonensis]EHP69265.1 precorrin-6y C5,15-methyltransferase (decarboxylating), CbiE subunit [Metallosphaera yellowstonensis MK1]
MCKVYVVGVGPGDPEMLTIKGARIISTAEVVVGWSSVVERFRDIVGREAKIRILTYRNQLQELDRALHEGSKIAVLDHGDPSVSDFQFLERIREVSTSHGCEVEVVPGVSSINYVLARANLDLSSAIFVTMHVRADESELFKELVHVLRCGRRLVVLPPPDERGVSRVASVLLEHVGDREVIIMERLSYPDEKVVRGKLSSFLNYVNTDLVAMVI